MGTGSGRGYGLGTPGRQGDQDHALPTPRRSARSRRAAGVGDVARERRDHAPVAPGASSGLAARSTSVWLCASRTLVDAYTRVVGRLQPTFMYPPGGRGASRPADAGGMEPPRSGRVSTSAAYQTGSSARRASLSRRDLPEECYRGPGRLPRVHVECFTKLRGGDAHAEAVELITTWATSSWCSGTWQRMGWPAVSR